MSRYVQGDFYKTHFDGPKPTEGDSKVFLACGGQRLATVLMYLNEPADGGATNFPLLQLAVRPRRGRALLFLPGSPDGAIDERLIHEALPAVDTKWVCQGALARLPLDSRAGARLPSSPPPAAAPPPLLLNH